jgi:hypothetical protein
MSTCGRTDLLPANDLDLFPRQMIRDRLLAQAMRADVAFSRGKVEMLIVRAAQMEHLARAVLGQFAEERRRHASTYYPRLCGFIGETAVRNAIAAGISAAIGRGLRNRVEVGLYLDLVFLLGSDFVVDPQFSWAAELLAPDNPERPLFRVRRTMDAAMAWLDDSHGTENEHLVRGLLRIRALTPDVVPANANTAEVVAWLAGLMPQKAAASGPDSMLALADVAAACAAGHGMAAAGDVAMTALHMFMLGSGFDHDPLVPWAEPILTEAGPDRASRLFAASLRYLDVVLH